MNRIVSVAIVVFGLTATAVGAGHPMKINGWVSDSICGAKHTGTGKDCVKKCIGGGASPVFVDCNAEGFFMLAKFSPILDGIREKNPGFLMKTAELVNRFSAASQRYEAVLKNVEARRKSLPARQEAHGQYSYPPKP